MSSAAPPALLLEQVQLLEGPDQPPVVTAVLLEAGAYGAQGEAARQRADSLSTQLQLVHRQPGQCLFFFLLSSKFSIDTPASAWFRLYGSTPNPKPKPGS